jgi:ribosome-associated protein
MLLPSSSSSCSLNPLRRTVLLFHHPRERCTLSTVLVDKKRFSGFSSPWCTWCAPRPLPGMTNEGMMRLRSCPQVIARRFSQVSNHKVEGYYRLQRRDIVIPEASFEIRTSRGSGPGGQGANCSSNKVELRLRMDALLTLLDDATYVNLVRQQQNGGALTGDGELLIVSAYEHRSALKNKDVCIDMIKDMIVHASWVPPVEADPVEMSEHTINRHKVERRKKGNALKMRKTARQGMW